MQRGEACASPLFSNYFANLRITSIMPQTSSIRHRIVAMPLPMMGKDSRNAVKFIVVPPYATREMIRPPTIAEAI